MCGGRVRDTPRQGERQSQGRRLEPSACCAESQSIKTATQGEEAGFDGNKKVQGRKHHMRVDTLGRIVAVVVTKVERPHSWLHRFRRGLIRWDKKAHNYLGCLHLACTYMMSRPSGLWR